MPDINVRLVTYNILADCEARNLDQSISERRAVCAWENRIELIKNEILSLRPDILCMQEVEAKSLEVIKNALGSNYGYALTLNEDARYGCAIFYLRNVCTLQGRVQPFYYDDTTGNAAQIAKFMIGNRFVGVANTQLYHQRYRTATNVFQMNQLLRQINSEDEEWVICGDFNAGHHSQVTQLLERNGFNHDYRVGPTVNANAHLNTQDHVFHTAGISCRAEVNYRLQANTPMPNRFKGSNHLAVTAELYISESQGEWNPVRRQTERSRNPLAIFFEAIEEFFRTLIKCIFCACDAD